MLGVIALREAGCAVRTREEEMDIRRGARIGQTGKEREKERQERSNRRRGGEEGMVAVMIEEEDEEEKEE